MDRDRERSSRRDRDEKDRSYSRSPSRDRDRRRRGSRSRHYTGSRENPKPSHCLGVFGLSIHTTEEELYHLFSKYGRVDRVQVVLDAKTSRSRGFAFVYFESPDDAKVAKDQCTGMKISGKNIRVDFSITERAHTPTPGIYMGKPSHRSYDRHDRGRRDDYRSSRYSRRSPSPYYSGRSRRRYSRSRSRSYSPRRY